MLQGLIVSDPMDRIRHRLTVKNLTRAKFHADSEPFLNQTLQYFNLDFSHKMSMEFLLPLLPYQMQEGFLLLQLPKLAQGLLKIYLVRQKNLTGKYRFQQGNIATLFPAKTLPGKSA